MLALPGCAYLYQGEELGLPEVLDLPDELRQDPVLPSGAPSGGATAAGCRALVRRPPPYGFGPDGAPAPWLPRPATWGRADRGGPGRRSRIHIGALPGRAADPPRPPALGDGELRWLPAPSPDVLVFARDPGFVCAVNLGATAVPAPVPGTPLCASGPLDGGLLPADTAAWWSTDPAGPPAR